MLRTRTLTGHFARLGWSGFERKSVGNVGSGQSLDLLLSIDAVTFERGSVESVTARPLSLQPSCQDQAMACLRAVPHPRRAGHPQCSVPDDVSPAGDAARRTPDGRGPWQRWRHSQRAVSLRANGGGTSLAQPPHCKSASVQDWHLKCRRVGLPVRRQCPIDQHTATRREMPRNRRSGPAGDTIDRSR